MPTPSDLKSQELEEDDPDDQLRMELDQGQGNNLAGGPQPPQAAFLYGQGGGPPQDLMGPQGPSAPVQPPSPRVPGPLSALAQKPGAGKPKIKLLAKKPATGPKPHIKLKSKKKPHFRLRATNV